MCEKRKKSHTKEELIKKHGEEWYDKRIEQLSYINTLPYYIEKHGKEEGTRLYNEKNKRIGRGNTLDWYKENYENKEDAVYFYLKKYKKSLNKASKESMNVFWPLIDWLFEKNICEFKDIYLGIPESHEYFLNAKKQLNRFYKYDFTIPKFNIIIEYNGEAFHPNPKWLKDAFDKWKNWQNHFNFKSANDIYIENLQKLNFARNKGFTVLELWSSDSVEVNINKCKENILQNCK
jgi:very-short-patch-repair endonuclease